MSRQYIYRSFTLAAAFLLCPLIAVAAPAARVEFVVGSVSATTATGETRSVQKGSDIASGETVTTRDGRAQLRFSDGAYVSLQPQSVFRIDEYRFDGKPDGSERGFFSLLKGGLRTITGLVGRTNKRNYQVSTTVATIGIRGTEYTLAYTNSLSGSVGEGEIEVCNSGGCLPVASGGSFFVSNNGVRPEITSKKTDLPPNGPNGTGSLPTYVSGDQTTESGDPIGLALTGTQTVSLATHAGLSVPQDRVTGQFDSAGGAIQIGSLSYPKGLEEVGSDFGMSWGRGFDSAGLYTHYVAGIPTPLTDLAQLAATNTIATYALVPNTGTTPTADLFGATPFAVGKLTGGSLKADFSQGLVGATLNVTMPGFAVTSRTGTTLSPSVGSVVITPQDIGLTITSTMHIISGTSTFAPLQTASGSCVASAGSCQFVGMSGLFSGPNAAKAGVVYMVVAQQVQPASCFTSPCDVLGGAVKGAAIFAKQ